MMWIAFAVAALCAAAFVLAGLLRRGVMEPSAGDVALNRALYKEKLAELTQQEAQGELDSRQRQLLELEYQRQFLVDSADRNDRTAGDSGRWVFPLLALLVPLFAFFVYSQIGASGGLALRHLIEQRFDEVTAATPAAEVEALDSKIVERLQQLQKSRPKQPVYPVLLARLSQDRGDFSGAIGYYRDAIKLLPDDGALLAEYAQLLFRVAGNRMTDEVIAAVRSAYAQDPDNQTALGLMGIAAFQQADYAGATRYWQQAQAQLPPDSPARVALLAGISSAEERLGQEPQAETVSPDDSRVAEKSLPASAVVVDVTLADGLEVPPETTVFVYARAWQGAPVPLAIKRLTRADLPARVTLDESMAMNPAMALASADELEIVARVSFAGTAAAASGDIEGRYGPLQAEQSVEPVALVIEHKIP